MAHPLGLESGTVVVVPYDSRWPELFRAEAERIVRSIAPSALHLEHVGSTAVPGLAAKPVIDLLGGIPEGASMQRYVDLLVGTGYDYRGDQGIPGREFFRRGTPRSYHLHLTVMGGDFWREHVAFRDALRASTQLRDEYAALKRALAERFPRDREAYIEGKGPFVRRVLQMSGR